MSRLWRVVAGITLTLSFLASADAGASASAHVTATTIPSPTLAAGGTIDATSCVSGRVCVVIGWNHHGDHGYLWAQRWSAGSWHTLPSNVLNPDDQPVNVDCVSATWCMVTGSDGALSLNSHPFADVLRGNRWTHLAFPANAGGDFDTPTRLDCVSVSFCMSVGTYVASRPHFVDATYLTSSTWNGRAWHLVAIASPRDNLPLIDPGMVAGGEHPTADPNSLSCVSSRFCLISGSLDGVFNDLWNGVAWRPASGLNREGYDRANSSFWAGACVSTTFCLAGGGYWISGSIARPMIEEFNGTRWRNMSLARLPAVYADHQGFLVTAIHCEGANLCVALVDGSHASPRANALVWSGARWTYVALTSTSSLTKVCTADSHCVNL